MNREEMKAKFGNEYVANVIRIIDDRTILVNAGVYLLNVGDKIQVYELGEEIKDLDGCVLSRYFYIKDELEVIHVEDNYSVCQKQETVTKVNHAFALSPILEIKKTEYVPLNVDLNDIDELKPNDPLIRVGDPIKMV